MVEHGKKFNEVAKLVEENKEYTPDEACALVKQTVRAKFDETVELHIRMGLDPRQATQQVRGVALLPHGLGKQVRVLVFAQGDAEKVAKSAGADFVGSDDVIKQIEDGWLEFDTAIATPDMMSKVGKLGKMLGRKGLMPNPKSGTVVSADDLPRVIEDSRKGRVEFKLDKQAIVHVPLGKASFESEKIKTNMAAVMESIVRSKPSGAKGQYIKSVTMKSTMGPSIPITVKAAEIMTTA
ncbi:MAG: 50S ribosomal protein L1 [Dehalococcoidia bacterium]|nr:50S ribosomal protein L1 [Dehalococcoidia bacterium]